MKRQARILAVMALLFGVVLFTVFAIDKWGEYFGIGVLLGACAVALYWQAAMIVDILGRDASDHRSK